MSWDKIQCSPLFKNNINKGDVIITENELLLRKSAIKWVNEYYEKDDCILLKVFRKDLTESYDILIDKFDFKLVSQCQWYTYMNRKNTHLKNILEVLWTTEKNGKKYVYNIYQWILDTKHKNVIIDHKNTNRLDNRRDNLRISSPTENAINQTYKGYNYDKPTKKFLVRIAINGKCTNIGRYKTEAEAEMMYLKAMILMGKDKISEYHNNRILELGIKLTNEDYQNKYIQKVINLYNT